MIPFLGRTFLLLALAAAIYVVPATALAFRQPPGERARWLASAHNGILAVWLLLSAASITLITAFLVNDFSINYVWGHSTKAQPIIYKISAFWGGQDGSLLMWAWMLAAYAALIAVTGRRARLEIAPAAGAVMSVVGAFFIALIAFKANPFSLIPSFPDVPADGRGLNPLLQNYWMQIHPPTLYLGYTGCTVPFAFAIAGLLHRRFDAEWVNIVRRWTLVLWIILTIGIIMGGAWAYETLGWGGYWAWDPVENASLMPWLTATAFLHSIMIQARRGLLRNWNMVLVTLTFLLSVFGTFLTRSGVVSSIHAFSEGGIGGYFLGFLGFALITSFGLIIWRREELANTADFDSPLSREGAFLLNNWILLASAFAILWGTVFPSVSEALTGQTISVGKPYFNRVMVPLGLILLALTGIGPLMPWRRASWKSIGRTLRIPVLIMLLASPLLWTLAQWRTGAGTAFCLAVFVVTAITLEFVRGSRARRAMTGESLPQSFGNLLLKNKQRYGGYIVHLGIAMMFVGITGSSAFQIENDPIEMKVGQRMSVGEYILRFDGLVRPTQRSPEKQDEIAAKVNISTTNGPIADLYPSIDFFKAMDASSPDARAGQPAQQARRPAILSSPANDLYLALADYDTKTGTATIKSYLNPLVMWVWLSALFFIGGTVIAVLPDRRRIKAVEDAPEGANAPESVIAPRSARVIAAMAPEEAS